MMSMIASKIWKEWSHTETPLVGFYIWHLNPPIAPLHNVHCSKEGWKEKLWLASYTKISLQIKIKKIGIY